MVPGARLALTELAYTGPGCCCCCCCCCCCSWHTYRLLVYMHEVPDLTSKTGGIRRLDRYDQLAEYVFGEC
jgi:hypothetical protein